MRHSVLLAMGVVITLVPASLAGTVKQSPGFNFVYVDDWGTRIDTYDSTLTKDLVLDPDTTIHFVISKADLDTVYQMVTEIGFFDRSWPHPGWSGCVGAIPSPTITFQASLGEDTRRLSWRWLCTDDDSRVRELSRLALFISRMIRRQPEYKALPRPRGGYF